MRRLAQAALIALSLGLLAFAWRCDEAWFDRHIFLPQQFFIVADRAIVTAARAAAGITGLLLLLATPFLPRGPAGRRVALACLLALPAAELVMQWKTRHLIRGDLVRSMDALTSVDARYGVTLNPSMDRIDREGGRAIRWITDAVRRRTGGRAIDESLPSLVFTGESTVAGAGLQWEETFPALLGERLGLQVVNLASMAYSAEQSRLRLLDHLPKLQRPAAIAGVFMPGLLGRVRQPGPLDRIGLYRIWRHLYWSDAEFDEAVRSVRTTFEATNALARERRVPCVFVVTAHTPDWLRRELFEGLDSVSVEIPRGELLSEGHPGPAGNARIAAALEPRLRAALSKVAAIR